MTPPKFLANIGAPFRADACPLQQKRPTHLHRAIIRNDQNNVPEMCALFQEPQEYITFFGNVKKSRAVKRLCTGRQNLFLVVYFIRPFTRIHHNTLRRIDMVPIRKLKGANMDIDLATPQELINWQQDGCPWNDAEGTKEHRCAVKNVSICPYFCGVEYLDILLCCYPNENPFIGR
jgi:hypothetical protein